MLFLRGSVNGNIKQIADPTPIDCHQFVMDMKLPCDKVAEIEAATCEQSGGELWHFMWNED